MLTRGEIHLSLCKIVVFDPSVLLMLLIVKLVCHEK